jgi:hypothetical protein
MSAPLGVLFGILLASANSVCTNFTARVSNSTFGPVGIVIPPTE